MSAFRDEFVEAGGDLDDAFGEQLEIRRMAQGEFTRASTLAAAPYRLTGILDLPTEVVRPDGILDGAKSEILMTRTTADFLVSLFSAERPIPRDGDEIVAVDRPGSPRYRVLDAKTDGVSRIVCQLSPL